MAILHSLPVSSGNRTIARVDLARRVLGCETYSIANLYPEPLPNVNGIGRSDEAIWVRGRSEIERQLSRGDCSDVLLGYGVQEPVGAARQPFRDQLRWLQGELSASSARVWVFGGRPTHPSRWQRVAHRHAPGGGVDALAAVLLAPYSL